MNRSRSVFRSCALLFSFFVFGVFSTVDGVTKKTSTASKKKTGKQAPKPAQAIPSSPAPIPSAGQGPTGDRILFSDGFSELSRQKWWATRGSWGDRFGEGKRYDASGVTCRENVAMLRADKTNEVGVLYTAPIPVPKGAKLVIRRQMFAHAANRTFGGDMEAFGVSDPSVSAAKPDFAKHLFALTYNNFKEGTDLNCFSLQCGQDVPEGPGTHQGGRAPKTTPIWDQWFDEEIVYDSGTGETVYSINGEDRMRAAGSPLSEPYIKFLIHPYGWGTGHYLKMRAFEVIQLVDQPQKTATTGCTGLPPLTFDPPKPDPGRTEPPSGEPPERHLPGKPEPGILTESRSTNSDSAKTGPAADRARALHELGVALFPSSAGNPEVRRKALQNLAEAAKLDPTNDAYTIDFADALLHDDNDLGKIMGVEIFEEMLAADPTSDAALGRVVFGLVELGDVDGALDRLAKRAKDSRPLPFTLASALTSLAITHGKTARAAAILRQAHRQAPADDMISVYLAITERELGNRPVADEILTTVAKGPAESVPAAYARALLEEVRQ